ncbi:MAG: TRAP transporter substrate-binding protein DctP [Burkholderiales bacterium]|nr:TRAP transporter substrate-binding protein DctP [Burkholderiales bacterium]
MALVLMLSSVWATELAVLVPLDDKGARDFLEALSASPQVKEAELTFRALPIDALGSPNEVGALIQQGKVPLAFLRPSQIAGYETDRVGLRFTSLLSHPLLVRDSTEQFFIEDSVIGDAVMQELGRKGFVVLGFWNVAPASLVVSKPVKTIADLRGLKLRAPDSRSREVLVALGATPMTLSAGEIYSALERRVVDGSETPVGVDNKKFMTAAKGGSLLGNFQPRQGFLVANEAAWVGLRQRERAAIEAAVRDARQRSRASALRDEADLPNLAKANGLTFTSFSTLGAGSEAARSTWLKRAGDGGAAALTLLDRVKQAQPPKPTDSTRSPRSATPPRIFFATNRNDDGASDLSYRFGIARSSTSRLACGEVAYTPDQPRSFGAGHKGAIAVKGGVAIGPKPCASLVRLASRETGTGGEIVMFIHGFNNSFDFAVRRAIALAQDFPVKAPVLVFSWPSQGASSGYDYDIGSVTFTRPYTKDLVAALFSEGMDRVSLLAHSMGSQVAFQVLEFVTDRGKSIDSVVFVAPDVPRTNFVQGISLYGSSAKLATLYANEHDRALALSEVVNREAPAGLGGSSRLITAGVETVDVSEVDQQFLEANHSGAFDVQKVATDVALLLRQRLKASLRSLPSSMQDGMMYWSIKP